MFTVTLTVMIVLHNLNLLTSLLCDSIQNQCVISNQRSVVMIPTSVSL